MKDAIVVGAGIVGSTVAKALRDNGMHILHLADQREHTGTSASGGHLRPEWFGGMPKGEYEPAMQLLADTWGMLISNFTIKALGVELSSTKVYRVDTDIVLAYKHTNATVTSLEAIATRTPVVKYNLHVPGEPEGRVVSCEEQCKLLVLATGVWAADLLHGEVPELATLQAKQGISFRWPARLKQAFIKPWAPYKQVVAHQQTPNEAWVGDGTAILAHNWTKERNSECLLRCRKALEIHAVSMEPNPTRHTIGLRPYIKLTKGCTDPCLLKKLGPAAWLATGAGKNGTIAAGWVAHRLTAAMPE